MSQISDVTARARSAREALDAATKGGLARDQAHLVGHALGELADEIPRLRERKAGRLAFPSRAGPHEPILDVVIEAQLVPEAVGEGERDGILGQQLRLDRQLLEGNELDDAAAYAAAFLRLSSRPQTEFTTAAISSASSGGEHLAMFQL